MLLNYIAAAGIISVWYVDIVGFGQDKHNGRNRLAIPVCTFPFKAPATLTVPEPALQTVYW